MSSRGRALSWLVTSLICVLVVGCSAPQVTVVNVVGVRLDEATDSLLDAGLKYETQDRLESRAVLWHSNWVVVDQDPSASGTVAKDTKVRLGVVKVSDPAAPDMLPADSPVRAQILKQRADDAARAREQIEADARAKADAEAAKKAEVKAFRDKLAKLLKTGTKAVKILEESAKYAERQASLVQVATNAQTLKEMFGKLSVYAYGLDVPSDAGLDWVKDDLAQAAALLAAAADDMLMVADFGAPSSIASMRSNLKAGTTAWKKIVERIG